MFTLSPFFTIRSRLYLLTGKNSGLWMTCFFFCFCFFNKRSVKQRYDEVPRPWENVFVKTEISLFRGSFSIHSTITGFVRVMENQESYRKFKCQFPGLESHGIWAWVMESLGKMTEIIFSGKYRDWVIVFTLFWNQLLHHWSWKMSKKKSSGKVHGKSWNFLSLTEYEPCITVKPLYNKVPKD